MSATDLVSAASAAKDIPGVKYLGLIVGLLLIWAAIRAMFKKR